VKIAKLTTDRQWIRAVDQHLVPDRPHGGDGLELATFSLGPRTGRYLTVRSWTHCAIAKVAERHERRDPALVRKVRAEYRAEGPCDGCEPRRSSAVGHGDPMEGPRVTDLVRVTSAEGEDALDEVERAILRARQERSHRDRGPD